MVDIARRVVPLCADVVRRLAEISRAALENDPLALMKSDVRALLRLPCGLRPRRMLRAHHARGVRRERAAHRALPRGAAPGVPRRAARPRWHDAAGRARLRARRPDQGAHRHHQLAHRQAACGVRPQPERRRRGPFPRGDGGGRARARHPRGAHHQLQRVRLEPRRATFPIRIFSTTSCCATTTRPLPFPTRSSYGQLPEDEEVDGGVAHREACERARGEGALHGSAEGGEGRRLSTWPRRTRSTRSCATRCARTTRTNA